MISTGFSIYYYCYDHNIPRGGQRDTYRHVEFLHKAGLNASVLHLRPGFRVDWFESNAPTTDLPTFLRAYNPDRDFVVLPEDAGAWSQLIPGRKVIFNKSVFYGFHSSGYSPAHLDPCLDPSVAAIFCVSQHNRAVLQFVYPNSPIYLVSAGVRTDLFRWSPLATKTRKVVYMPKSEYQIRTIYQMIGVRAAQGFNLASQFEWIPLKGMTEREAGALLSEAYIFLFANIEEGLPQVLLEANTCGCLTMCYKCDPLVEVMPRSAMTEVNDLTSFCRKVESALSAYGSGDSELQAQASEGHRMVADYTLARQEASALAAWEHIAQTATTSGRNHSSIYEGKT